MGIVLFPRMLKSKGHITSFLHIVILYVPFCIQCHDVENANVLSDILLFSSNSVLFTPLLIYGNILCKDDRSIAFCCVNQ